MMGSVLTLMDTNGMSAPACAYAHATRRPAGRTDAFPNPEFGSHAARKPTSKALVDCYRRLITLKNDLRCTMINFKLLNLQVVALNLTRAVWGPPALCVVCFRAML